MERIPNLATYYILPLVELSKSSFGDGEDTLKREGLTDKSNFVNCFLTTENFVAVEVTHLDLVPRENWVDNPYYFTDFILDSLNHMILYRVTGSYLRDLGLFRAGKYSHFSLNAQSRIAIFNGFDDTDEMMRIIARDEKLKEQLEREYEIKLPEGAEVKSKPTDKNFIDVGQLIKSE